VVEFVREGIGEEHPFCDSGQNIFILLYLVIWTADSFWLRLSTLLIGSFHWVLRGSLAVISIVVGIYLAQGAHNVVFDKTPSEFRLIDWGVFGIVRHPMYLGVLLVLFGLFFWSLSLVSLFVWICFFFFYDRMANYEEEYLIRIFGEDYEEYKRKVGKWIPVISR
jgi:protein-S-isoprenylcysteine O-methyltransferase Ste14